MVPEWVKVSVMVLVCVAVYVRVRVVEISSVPVALRDLSGEMVDDPFQDNE